MSDNVTPPGFSVPIAADDVGAGLLVQRIKPTHGVDGTATDVSTASPLPIQLRSANGDPFAGNLGQMTALTPQAFGSLVSAAALPSIPSDALLAVVCFETQTVRWFADGTSPTTSFGMPLLPNQYYSFPGDATKLASLKFIQTAATATGHVSYFK